jgi:hypothetical protein
MWTAANRARMAAIEKKTRRYPTDLTDEEWSQVEGLLPKPRTDDGKIDMYTRPLDLDSLLAEAP